MTTLQAREREDGAETVAPTKTMPGIGGFWVFVGGDLIMFTLMMLAFTWTRRGNEAEFELARQALDTDRGGINTLVLLTSSACIAMALARIRAARTREAANWTAAGIVGGLVFIALKSSEYVSGISAGHTPSESEFYVYYFALTGVHLGHVVAGCLILAIFWVRMRRSQLQSTLGYETAACYWHLVDFLWLLIFPLLYLIR